MRVPGVCRDPASAYDMHSIEGLGTMLGVETDRINHGEGLFDGLEHRSVIVHIGTDRFESGSFVREHSPASFGMTRCDPHRVSAVEQTANNATAEKARAAENQNPAKLSRHARLRRLWLRPRALRPEGLDKRGAGGEDIGAQLILTTIAGARTVAPRCSSPT